jgi:signal transduction histidine kinase
LKFYAKNEAQGKAQTHLVQIQQAYQTQTTELSQQLAQETKNTLLVSAISQANAGTQAQVQNVLLPLFVHDHLASLRVITRNHELLAQLQANEANAQSITQEELSLVDQAVSSNGTVLLRKVPQGEVAAGQWQLLMAATIPNAQGMPGGVLLASQPVDGYLTQSLAQHTGNDMALCIAGQFVSSTGTIFQELSSQTQNTLRGICTPGESHMLTGARQYLTLGGTLDLAQQSASSPRLIAVDVEQVYGLNVQIPQQQLIIAGMGLFIFALGILLYIILIRGIFTRPIHQLQSDVDTLIAHNNNGIQPVAEDRDEFVLLSRSFHQLAESLEHESQAMTEQMRNVLIMSDALISTLNLDQLLGEIVSRLGTIMQVKHVSLLLYGREMLSPWAVAHYADSSDTHEQPPAISSATPGGSKKPLQDRVTVHIDPDGDITLAVTTKMVALPSSKGKLAGGKQTVANGYHGIPYNVRRPRIPRLALRELDLILARMVIQKHKIAYGEDIAAIFEERQENWTRMALDTGYRSVIAVPLLLQEQAIGAFILYADEPHVISSRDTFLLSTAAIQAAMAIQNALLFAEVKEKNTALEQANRLKSQFLANVTHELRTPLHSIISYGALLLEGFVDGELTAEQEQHIQFMVRRAEDLSQLVDDMLDLSKIEADKIEVRVEQLDVQHSLGEVVEQLKPLANNKELYLRLEMPSDLPMVIADGHRLRQVAINLVSNALKFTEKGGVTIRCQLVREGEMVKISVHDTGIGISPAALGYIFEAFRQADGSTTRRFGGTGLGLTIARKLVELQGGDVAVESIPGHGSIFSFTLPVVPREESEQ